MGQKLINGKLFGVFILGDKDTGEPINPTGGTGGPGGDASAANQVITNTRVGDVTEGAPASDTASSGLNGRLQRIAQRLTSLIAQLPASLGIGAAATALRIVHGQGTLAAGLSTTITTGGVAQNVLAANASRTGWKLQNHSAGDLWVSTLATAVVGAPSLKIPSNALYESPIGAQGTGALSVIGATTGQSFTVREW